MQYTFYGIVLPERAAVTINGFPILAFKAPDAGFGGEIKFSIDVSKISITVRITEGNPDIFTLRNYVESIIRSNVDFLGYIKGCGYDLELSSATDELGNHTVFGVDIARIAKQESIRPIAVQDFLTLLPQSNELRRALADLRQSIRSSSDTGFYCFRALECLRHYFVLDSDSKEAASWKRMEKALNYKRSFIRPLDTFGGDQRHGKDIYMSAENREDCMEKAWKIVDRFCIYIKNGEKNLEEKDHMELF